jgi:AmpD protein
VKVDREKGLLCGVRLVLSPNCDERPAGAAIDLIVIHCISLPPGQFGGPWIEALFTNALDPNAHPYFREIQDSRVSAHLLIRRDGEITQYVPFQRRAWHAGQSSFAGRRGCNDFAIGIELEGSNEIAYTDFQYHQLTKIIAALMYTYSDIIPERIVGHADIAPGRKTDPGSAFHWQRLRSSLGENTCSLNSADTG